MRPIEYRPIDLEPGAGPGGSLRAGWIRIGEALPADEALHRAALAHLSDLALLDSTLAPHGRSLLDGSVQVASLDHALWLHRPARADDWLLYVQESPNANGGTGLARGLIYGRDRRLVASVAQEGLTRPRRTIGHIA